MKRVVEQVRKIRAIPARLSHVGRKATHDLKPRSYRLLRYQHGCGEAVISFQDGERTMLVQSDQEDGALRTVVRGDPVTQLLQLGRDFVAGSVSIATVLYAMNDVFQA